MERVCRCTSICVNLFHWNERLIQGWPMLLLYCQHWHFNSVIENCTGLHCCIIPSLKAFPWVSAGNSSLRSVPSTETVLFLAFSLQRFRGPSYPNLNDKRVSYKPNTLSVDWISFSGVQPNIYAKEVQKFPSKQFCRSSGQFWLKRKFSHTNSLFLPKNQGAFPSDCKITK